VPHEPEVHGLLALMLISDARYERARQLAASAPERRFLELRLADLSE
jgi:predicted RNA polymerase sigma factor